MAKHRIEVSATELPHFRRLVRFLEDVSEHADDRCDVVLQRMVREVRIDLLKIMSGPRETEDFDV